MIIFERNPPLEPTVSADMAKGRNSVGMSMRVANLLGPYSSIEISWTPERDCADDSDEAMLEAKRELQKLMFPELTKDLRKLAELLGGELPDSVSGEAKTKKRKKKD